MSKIQIEQIDSLTTNGNLKVTPNGTGIVEVSGDDGGTLQLDNVKVKAPPATAQQNTTLVLPQDNIEAGKYLKVDSITGSGSTAVGQLSYATVAPLTADAINASNFTSGTIPEARYSIPGSVGGGLQLVSKNEVTSDNTINQFEIPLDDDTNYKLIGKNIKYSQNTWLAFQWLDAAGNSQNGMSYTAWHGPGNNHYGSTNDTSSAHYGNTNYHQSSQALEMDINNQEMHVSVMGRVHNRHDDDNYNKFIMTFSRHYTTSHDNKRIHKFKIYPAHSSSAYFQTGTTLLLYKYNRE